MHPAIIPADAHRRFARLQEDKELKLLTKHILGFEPCDLPQKCLCVVPFNSS